MSQPRGSVTGQWALGAPPGGPSWPVSHACCLSLAARTFFGHLNVSTPKAAKRRQVVCFRLFSCRSPRKTNTEVLGPQNRPVRGRVSGCPRVAPPQGPGLALRSLTDGSAGRPRGAGGASLPPSSSLVILKSLTFLFTFSRCLSQEREANGRPRCIAGRAQEFSESEACWEQFYLKAPDRAAAGAEPEGAREGQGRGALSVPSRALSDLRSRGTLRSGCPLPDLTAATVRHCYLSLSGLGNHEPSPSIGVIPHHVGRRKTDRASRCVF